MPFELRRLILGLYLLYNLQVAYLKMQAFLVQSIQLTAKSNCNIVIKFVYSLGDRVDTMPFSSQVPPAHLSTVPVPHTVKLKT